MKTLYTCIFGRYDDLKRILVKTPGWRYVCYTDQKLASSEWEIMQVGSVNSWESAKQAKMHHHAGLSIYVDASFVPNCNLDAFVEKYHQPGKISFMKHPIRDCVYEEINSCLDLRKDTVQALTGAKALLQSMGIKERAGLAASGIIIRDAEKSMIATWRQYMPISLRDQISWAIAAHQHPDDYHLFSYNYMSGKDFLFIPHLGDWRRKKYIEHYESHGYYQLIDAVPRV